MLFLMKLERLGGGWWGVGGKGGGRLPVHLAKNWVDFRNLTLY